MKRLFAVLVLGLVGVLLPGLAHAGATVPPVVPPLVLDDGDGWVTVTPVVSSYINVKNSVNSDHYVKGFRELSSGNVETYVLSQGENHVWYNGDGNVRIKIYIADSIDSYQYYYGGDWHACHDWASNDYANPTNDYYDVTIRTFYSGNCDGRN